MKILVLSDDRWHPASTPRQGLEALQKAEGFAWLPGLSLACIHFDWIENANEWSAEKMAEYPVVILTKSNNVSASDETNWMTEEVAATFVDYVRQGHGLLVIHSGSAGYGEVPALRQLMGGVFAHHPPQCKVTIEVLPEHPLTVDRTQAIDISARHSVPAFQVLDEHYFMIRDENVTVDVYMTTTSEHGAQPGGWRRTPGNGRVCMLTPGHNLEVWLHPNFQALLINALRWCAKLD